MCFVCGGYESVVWSKIDAHAQKKDTQDNDYTGEQKSEEVRNRSPAGGSFE